jgi:hypothetical protein
MKSIFLAMSILAFHCSVTRSEVIGGPIKNPTTGHWYYLLSESTWGVAESEAIHLGGHLVTVNDAAEQEWVYTTFGAFGGIYRSLWIGLNDTEEEGRFVWSSGELADYRNWQVGAPNNSATGDGEDCVHMWPPGFENSGQWNDLAAWTSNFVRPGVTPTTVRLYGVVEVQSINGDEVLEVSIRPAVRLAWPTKAGKKYQVQWTDDLASGQWNTLAFPMDGTGNEVTEFDAPLGLSRFYRILELK